MRLNSAKAAGIAVSSEGFVGAGLLARGLGDVLRRANARDHILALGVDQELAVKLRRLRSMGCA